MVQGETTLDSQTQAESALPSPRTQSPSPSARVLALVEGHRLTPTQRRIAQCLVEHATEAPFLSSTEVAELANTSQASVVRFASALGFDGYFELRAKFRSLGLAASTHAEPEGEADVRRNEFQHAVTAEIANLEALREELADPRSVLEAGRCLMRSRPLPVLGLRASIGLVHSFAYFAAKVHPDVRILDVPGTPLIDQLEQAVDAGATWLLVVALPRCPQETLEGARLARELGLKVATVADHKLSPLREYAEVVLPGPVGTSLVFDSHAAPTLLAMVLLESMCDAEPGHVQDRLESFEQTATRQHYFLTH